MAGEYAPSERPAGPDCTDRAAYGAASAIDQYITKQYLLAEEDYPADACPNRYYSKAKIDDWEITNSMTGALSTMNIPSAAITCTSVNASGNITAASFSANSKAFNIPHPSPDKEGMRLVHACLEGPENAVYVRGVLRNKDTIQLPDVWKDIVSPNSITVSLTSVGIDQGLMVKRVANNQVVVQAKPGLPIHCHYHIFAERNDVEKLITEVPL
jgi:hypothetical protein